MPGYEGIAIVMPGYEFHKSHLTGVCYFTNFANKKQVFLVLNTIFE